jgi:hypothetical protein
MIPHKSPKPFRVGRQAKKRGFERHDGGPIQKRIFYPRMIPQDIARDPAKPLIEQMAEEWGLPLVGETHASL